jgi:hypothetical protein
MNTVLRESAKTGALLIRCAECDWVIGKATEGNLKEARERMCHTCCELPEHNHNTAYATL